MKLREDPRVLRFVEAAQKFREIIDRENLNGKELIQALLPSLAELYAAGLGLESVDTGDLPENDSDAHRLSHDKWSSLFQKLSERLGSVASYWMLLDPLESDQGNLVAGDLGDDLADIYRDVMQGLGEWELGKETPVNEVVWQWRFDLSSHWGYHALNALKTLHWIEMKGGWGGPLRELDHEFPDPEDEAAENK